MNKSLALSILVTGIFLLSSFKDKPVNCLPAVIHTRSGPVSGSKSADGEVTSFKGIPFAAPPLNKLRWKAPQPAKPWKSIKQCVAFGPSPMQGKPGTFYVWTPEFLIPEQPISEDCLYLNVWTKAKDTHKKPVLVWIYGGGFSSGGSAVPIYDGEAMAKKGIVFVSFNYRVGIFGFFAHPELTKESRNHASGNYGLLDQIAALKWVKQNIAAFGGDPDNVTIAGQSAGSMSVCDLIASPLSKGLFNKAIAESGSGLIASARGMGTLAVAEQEGVHALAKADVKSLAELRQLSAKDIMTRIKGHFTPIADGYFLPEPVYQIYAENRQNNIPLITGWNADEGIVYNYLSKDVFISQMHEQYGADADELLKYYPASNDAEAAESQLQLNRDLSFAISGYQWGRLQSGRGNAPVYIYNFTRRPPAEGEYVKYKSFHTAEVAYALDNLKFLKRPFQPQDHHLARSMSAYWINFIKAGNPNDGQLPVWPAFNTKDENVMVLGDQVETKIIQDKQRLDFMLNLLAKHQ